MAGGPDPQMTDTSVPDPDNRLLRLAQQIGVGLFTLAITLLGLLLVTFIIGRVVPIDPVLSIVGERATEAQMQAVRDQLGLDLPMWQQFWIYLRDAVQGDLGTSIRTGEPIAPRWSLRRWAPFSAPWSAFPLAFWRPQDPAASVTRSSESSA